MGCDAGRCRNDTLIAMFHCWLLVVMETKHGESLLLSLGKWICALGTSGSLSKHHPGDEMSSLFSFNQDGKMSLLGSKNFAIDLRKCNGWACGTKWAWILETKANVFFVTWVDRNCFSNHSACVNSMRICQLFSRRAFQRKTHRFSAAINKFSLC